VGAAGWIGLGVGAWLSLSAVVAWCLGRMVRQRDKQKPRHTVRDVDVAGDR
jgi:hypothetical protein